MATESPYKYEKLAQNGGGQLVLREDVQGEELFKILYDDSKEAYPKLSPTYQQKVLSYFQTGK